MSIHRSSSSLHIGRLHQQQIFKEAQQSTHQSSSLHVSRQISRQLSQLIEDKNEMSRCIENVIQKSYRKINLNNTLQRKKNKHYSLHRQTHSFAPQLYPNNPCLKKLQSKVVKLKNRILPQDDAQGRVEMKINEIIMINHHPKDTHASLVKVGRKQDRELIKLGDNEVVNGYWNELSRESKISKENLVRIKENRVNMLMRQNADSEQDMKNILEIKERLNRKLLDRREKENRKSTDAYTNKNKKILAQFNIRNTNSHSLNNSLSEEETATPPRPVKKARQQITKELVQTNFIDYLRNKKERKMFLGELNKDLIEKQDVFKIYTFVKGGYNKDPFDIEGDFISLQRFNQSKESFTTLNELYKSIKSDCPVGRMGEMEQQMRHTFDRTFRSIVYLNELNGKIAPNQLLKLMKQRRVVG